jgi:steroid delta-isomerase-like uncharacterized protein
MPGSTDPVEQETALEVATRRWIEVAWQRADLTAFDALHTPGFVDHSPAGRDPDLQGFKRGVRGLYQSFPDFRATVKDQLIDARRGRVAVRWSATGTHGGAFLGIAPTHRTIRFEGIEIVQFEGGKIKERWGEWNGIEILAQLRGSE